MPIFTVNIDNYSVVYDNVSPTIVLESAGNSVGVLVFKPNGAILPQNTTNTIGSPPRQYYSLYYHFDDFQNVIDILRNEKPVYILCRSAPMGPPPSPSSTSPYGIGTGDEPVGEGE